MPGWAGIPRDANTVARGAPCRKNGFPAATKTPTLADDWFANTGPGAGAVAALYAGVAFVVP